MVRAKPPHSRGEFLPPTNLRLLGNPIAFIAEDHLRERAICALLDKIAQARAPDQDEMLDVLAFLREELPAHLADEEQDLFPLMRIRCAPEDEIDKVIDRMQADHDHAEGATREAIAILERAVMRRRVERAEDRATLADFATHSRRHLIVENAIILPLARARLTNADLDRLRLGMLKRRGLDRVMEAKDAE